MDKDEALKQALKFVEANHFGGQDAFELITAIKQALAAPVQEPVATVRTWHMNGDRHAELGDWELGLFKLPDGEHTLYTTPPAQPAPVQEDWGPGPHEYHSLPPAAPVQDVDWKDMYEKEKRRSEMWVAKYEKDIGPLEYAVPVAAPVQEPVAWIPITEWRWNNNAGTWEGLTNTTPPAAQRQWVGLSDFNIDELENEYMKSAQTAHQFLRAIEAKLKEKNT
jgi:hypothetical protein